MEWNGIPAVHQTVPDRGKLGKMTWQIFMHKNLKLCDIFTFRRWSWRFWMAGKLCNRNPERWPFVFPFWYL